MSETETNETPRGSSAGVWKFVGAGVAIVALAILARQLPVGEWLEAFNRWVADMGALGIATFVAVYIVAAVLFAPASVLTIGAGFAFGLLWGMVAVSIGSTLGAGAAFLVARYVARDWVRERMANGRKFSAVDRAVANQGWKIVGLLRLSPVFPYNALNYVLGLTGVRFWHYLLATWIGMLPGALLYVYLGYAGKESLEAASQGDIGILRFVYLGLGLAATLAVAIYVTRLARQAVKRETALDDALEGDAANPAEG